jgi:uncharacterized protein
MTQEAGNIAVLTEAYRRWQESRGGSVDHWMSICAEDIQFGSIAQGPPQASYLSSYNSRAALALYFDGLRRDWEMIDYVVDRFVAQGDCVVMIGHCSWRFRRNGRVVSTPKADSWRFQNGKAVEYYEFFDTAQLREAMA